MCPCVDLASLLSQLPAVPGHSGLAKVTVPRGLCFQSQLRCHPFKIPVCTTVDTEKEGERSRLHFWFGG